MVDSQIQSDLVQQLDQLPLVQQRQVLEFARSLSASPSRPIGAPSHKFLQFAGTINPEDCQLMIEAIEEGCEQIDPNEW